MEYVYTVYQEGSISKAADKLFITQPALSMAIRRVENKLNGILFDRSQYPLKLTHIGNLYIQKYHQIKLLENELTSQINDIYELQQGNLTIGGTHFVLSYVLPPIISEFCTLYPNITVQLYECDSNQLDTLLARGTIDLCLKCDTCSPPLQVTDYAFQDHLLLAVPKSYVSRYSLPDSRITLDMIKNNDYLSTSNSNLDFMYLSKLPYLVLTSGNNLRTRFKNLFQNQNIQPIIKMELEQFVTAYHLADSGMGATLTSVMIIQKSACNNLVYYQIDSPLMTRDFNVIGRHKSYVSHTASRFIEILKLYYS